MPYALNYCPNKAETKILDSQTRDAIAVAADESWHVESFMKEPDYIRAFLEAGDVSISCFDITQSKSTQTVETFREKNKNSLLVIISDASISPLLYMKPNVMASSLLLKPLTTDGVSKCMREIINTYYSARNNEKNEDPTQKYCVESKEGKNYVSYSDIIYFEAREKKIFLNTKNREMGFYSSLDAVEEQLPDYFVKCHRSFIVNTRKIEKIQPTQNLIYCDGDVVVPLSRGCKAAVKQALGEGKE